MSDMVATGMRMRPSEWALLVALSVLFGGAFFFGEVALRELPPFTIVFGRFGLAAVVLIVLVYAAGHRMPSRLGSWGPFFVMGALNNLVPSTLIVWGQTELTGGLAAILIATTPLFTVVLAHFLTSDERLSIARLAATLLGFAGVTVLIGVEALAGLSAAVLAELAVIGAAFCYACAGIFGRRFRDVPHLVTAAGQTSAATVMLVPLALMVDRPWLLPVPGLATWGAVVGLALLSTALGFVIYFRLLAAAGAANVLLVTFLVPVSAILLGASLLGERLEPHHFAGMALAGLALVAIDGRLFGCVRRHVTSWPSTAR